MIPYPRHPYLGTLDPSGQRSIGPRIQGDDGSSGLGLSLARRLVDVGQQPVPIAPLRLAAEERHVPGLLFRNLNSTYIYIYVYKLPEFRYHMTYYIPTLW